MCVCVCACVCLCLCVCVRACVRARARARASKQAKEKEGQCNVCSNFLVAGLELRERVRRVSLSLCNAGGLFTMEDPKCIRVTFNFA